MMLESKQPHSPDVSATAPLVFAPHHGGSLKDRAFGKAHRSRSGRRLRQRTAPLPRGLWNAGQTCHLGASVTALSAAPSLQMWLRNLKIEPHSSLATLRSHLLEASSSKERHGLDPRPLLHMLEMGSGWKSRHAQDAHETMARLLEILEHFHRRQTCDSNNFQGLNASNCRTILTNTRRFSLQTRMPSTMMPYSMVTSSSRKCCRCNEVSDTIIQKGSTVMLPVPSESTSLVSLFVSSQISKEIVEMQCDHCGVYGKHCRVTDIERLPQLLILHLQRAVLISGYTKATEGRATIPLVMDIPQGRPVRGRFNTRRYSLRSVVRHLDGTGGHYGHFDSIIRQDNNEGLAAISKSASWWHVDDDKVWPSRAAHACRPNNAYLVLYEMESGS